MKANFDRELTHTHTHTMYVCVCVCVCVCMYVCMHVCMYAYHRICLDFKFGPRNRGSFVRSECSSI